MRGDPVYSEIFGLPEPTDPLKWQGKAKLTKACQDLSTIIDSVGLCVFFAVRYLSGNDLRLQPTGILEYLNAATGADYSLEELSLAGERIFNAERLFISRAGFSRKDDSLPMRLTKEPSPVGPSKGLVCHLKEMLDEYYRIQEWTEEGVPSAQKLRKLGLS